MRTVTSPKPLRPLPAVSRANHLSDLERAFRLKPGVTCRPCCIDLDPPRAQLAWPVAFPDAPARRFNCATLTFKLLAKEGPTGSGQSPGEANIKRVEVQLPKLLPARLTTLQKSCTQAQFSANPAGCPEFSFVGTAIRIDLVGNISITKGLSTSVRNRFRMPPTETSN
jgi:hypothetical protein